MTPKPWMRYVGMPYRLGADPNKDNATDCIRMVLSVLRDVGFTPPEIERRWYNLLAAHNVAAIHQEWLDLTEQTAGPEEYAMTLLPTEGDFSIAIVVDNGLLTVRVNVGVIWVPLSNLRSLNFRRLKNA